MTHSGNIANHWLNFPIRPMAAPQSPAILPSISDRLSNCQFLFVDVKNIFKKLVENISTLKKKRKRETKKPKNGEKMWKKWEKSQEEGSMKGYEEMARRCGSRDTVAARDWRMPSTYQRRVWHSSRLPSFLSFISLLHFCPSFLSFIASPFALVSISKVFIDSFFLFCFLSARSAFYKYFPASHNSDMNERIKSEWSTGAVWGFFLHVYLDGRPVLGNGPPPPSLVPFQHFSIISSSLPPTPFSLTGQEEGGKERTNYI